MGRSPAPSDKVHLVPFGEYVPFESMLDDFGIQNVVEMPGGFSPAATRQLLTLPTGIKFYPLVCYEIIFPDEMTGDLGVANAILNVTNDAWFGATPGPYQHFQQARLRAVETGLPLIRNGNSGISAFVNARGEVIAGSRRSMKRASSTQPSRVSACAARSSCPTPSLLLVA